MWAQEVETTQLLFQAEFKAEAHLAASNGDDRQPLRKGRAVQLADELAQLGVCAAAEKNLPLLGRHLFGLLICVRVFAGDILEPEQRIKVYYTCIARGPVQQWLVVRWCWVS